MADKRKTRQQLVQESSPFRGQLPLYESSDVRRGMAALKDFEASKDEFQTFFDHIPVHAFVVDREHRRIRYSHAAPRYLKSQIGTMTHRLKGVEPAVRELWHTVEEQVLHSCQPAWYVEIRPGSHGKDLYCESRLTPVLDQNGQVRVIIGMTQEITGYKQAMEELERAHTTLEHRVPERTAQLATADEDIERTITPPKPAEEAQGEKGTFGQAVLNSLTSLIAVLDRRGEIIAVNEAMKRFVEEPKGSALWHPRVEVGANYLEVWRAADGMAASIIQTAVGGIEKVLAGELDEFELEYPCHPADENTWFRMRASLLTSQAGGAVVAHRSIARHKQTERQLQESNKMLKILSQAQSQYISGAEPRPLFKKILTDLLWLTGSEYGFIAEVRHTLEGAPYLKTFTISDISWDDETRRFYEREAADGLEFHNLNTLFGEVVKTGKPVVANSPSTDARGGGLPDDHPPINSFLGLPVHAGEELVGVIAIANRPKGYDNTVIDYIRPFLVSCGNMIEALQNNIRRKTAEEALRQNQALLQKAFDGISDPLIMLDRDLKVKILNKAAREYYQLSDMEDVTGRPCFEAFGGRSGPCEDCMFPVYRSQSSIEKFQRNGFMDPDKVEEVTIYHVPNEEGEKDVSIIRISDISRTKLLEKQMLHSERLAALGLLVSGIAHEINNPNAFISFNVPILRRYLEEIMPITDGYAEEHPDFEVSGLSYGEFRRDVFKLLDNMEHGSERINSIVGGLKSFVRKRDQAAKHCVELKPIMERAVAICQGEIKKRVKSFELQVPDDLPPVFTDTEALEQVLVNLLVNAIHSLDKTDSWVKLSAVADRPPHARCVIEVIDNGCGIEEQFMDKIFDPFFTTKPPTAGTGLGLYVSRTLVEALGGKIEVESEPNRGSRFRIVLQNTEQCTVTKETRPDSMTT